MGENTYKEKAEEILTALSWKKRLTANQIGEIVGVSKASAAAQLRNLCYSGRAVKYVYADSNREPEYGCGILKKVKDELFFDVKDWKDDFLKYGTNKELSSGELKILTALSEYNEPIGIDKIIQDTGMHPVVCEGGVKKLVRSGHVMADSDDSVDGSGNKLFNLYKLTEKGKKCVKPEDDSGSQPIPDNIDKTEVIDYLKHILNIYSNIYWYKNRYIQLNETKKKLLYKSLNTIRDSVQSIVQLPDEPQKPFPEYTEPNPPIMKEAGFFNKKKIESENYRLQEEYERDMALYKEYINKVKKYESDLLSYDTEMKKIDNYPDQDEVRAKVEEARKTDAYKKIDLINYELNYIISMAKENSDALKSMFNKGIIFSKYHNCVAISYFCEYMESGRCDTLEGTNGAYNLYESEMKMEGINSKLELIIDSLDEIKTNQKYMYNELNQMNQSLELINGQLLVNNMLNAVQIAKLDEIESNTSVAAYYSEKNAKLTNALGYLVALK